MSTADKVKKKAGGYKGLNKIFEKGSKEKKIAIGIAAGVIVLALAVTIALNLNKKNYEVLFPGMTQEENAEVFAVLQARSIEAQRNDNGEVTVPAERVGDIMLEMSGLGYPKSVLPFNIFSDNTGFTTTEFEKKQYLLMNLQDRLERTMEGMQGIKRAIVTLSVPDESNYVWDEGESNSTGSVSLSFLPGFVMTPEKVSAIKNLVANSVPRLLPGKVTVVNADTTEELAAVSDDSSGSAYGLDRLDFEAKVEEKLENKIRNVMSIGYPADQFRVSATVVIDYDKMLTEDLQYVPSEDNKGVQEHFDEQRTLSGAEADAAGGVAGEENNTDVNTYENEESVGAGKNTGDYARSEDYLVSYIRKQIEKDNVKLLKATVAISVNDTNLTAAKRQNLIDAASKAANIAPEDIVVTGFDQIVSDKSEEAPPKVEAPQPTSLFGNIDDRIIIIAGIVLLVLLFILIVILATRSRRHAQRDEEIFGQVLADNTALESAADAEQRATEKAVENAISRDIKIKKAPTEEVRAFAKANPEIVATMISSWLKEDES